MRIKSLSYRDATWQLPQLELSETNLIVGRNAVGKTKVLDCLDLFVEILNQKEAIYWGGEWKVTFENAQQEVVEYSFSTSSKTKGISFERLRVNGELMMSRNKRLKDGGARVRNYLNDRKYEYVYPPKDKLVVHTNRDVQRYPFLEDIVNWAEESYGFKFGNISPYTSLREQKYDFLTAVEEIPKLLQALEKEDREQVLKDINSLGYEIERLSIHTKGGISSILVKERDLYKNIPHHRLSQGMFRALALVIYIRYLLRRRKPTTIIIDDLGEGLDYRRSKALGEFLFNILLESNIQLIATTNNSPRMEVVDLKYWNVLTRKGKVVSSAKGDEPGGNALDF